MAMGTSRKPYNLKVLTERFRKDEKYFRIHDDYKPSLKSKILTGKFYSPHDFVDLSSAEPELLKQIEIYHSGEPKQRYSKPVSVNQVYGWHSAKNLVPLRKEDSRYYASRVANISKLNVNLIKKK